MNSYRYFVELRGCNFKNKGDVLMAEAVIGEMQARRPDIRLVSRTLNTRGALADAKTLGKCISPRYSARRSASKAAALGLFNRPPVSTVLDLLFGIVPEQKIRGIVDVCGFSYGDAWGPAALEADYRYFSSAVDRGNPVILMPKSFGPFADPAMAAQAKAICEMATLCFVRDSISFEHLLQAGVAPNAMVQFPDFTASAPPIGLVRYAHLAGRPAIIPNYRMIDAGQTFSEKDYVGFLTGLYRLLDKRYGKPFVLIHDTGKDPLLADQLAGQLGHAVETIQEPTARGIKGIIAASCFVYSDRLHGAISAALQKIPVASMGWSHKYRYMLADFGLLWAWIGKNSGSRALQRVEEIIEQYQHLKENEQLNADISAHLASIKEKNSLMWEMIFMQLNKNLPA